MRGWWSWLGAFVLSTGCAPSAVAVPNAPSPEPVGEESGEFRGVEAVVAPAVAAQPWRKEIYREVWPSLDATLLGVDANRRRAYIKLRMRKPSRYVIDTVDIDSGRRLDRWEAGETEAPRLASYDARFSPLAGGHASDLRRLASMVSSWSSRANREGSAWPVADASPNGDRVVFMRGPAGGRQGDWLFLHDVASERAVRIGRQTVASYDAKFSPDGQHLAWRGCVGSRPCRYFLYVSSVERASNSQAPHRMTGVRDPRGPIWSPDGGVIYTLARNEREERCVMRTTAPGRRPWRRPKTSHLVCDTKLSSFVLSPDGESILYAKRAGRDSEIAWRELGATEPSFIVQLRHTSELTTNDRGLVLADHEKGLLALDLQRQRRRLYQSDDGGFVFVPNIHWLGNDIAIMLEKSFEDNSIRLVRMNVAQFLEAG